MSGHLWRGMSRADVKEFGDLIDDGQAALVIVGESKLQEAVEKAGDSREAGGQGTRCRIEGHRQGRPGSRQRSQLTRTIPPGIGQLAASPNAATLEDA